MDISRDNPEIRSEAAMLLERSRLVEAGSFAAQAALYGEFGPQWSESAPALQSRPVNGAGDVINRTFVEAQHLEVAHNEAVSEAQRRVMEAIDEFTA